MKDNEKFFSFEFEDEFEEISSSSEPKEPVFEDIVSDTSLENMEFVTLDELSGKGSRDFLKKKRGIAGFFQNLGIWWRNLRKGYKAAIISGTAVVLIAAIIMTLPYIPYMIYNYKSITGNREELGFSDIINEKVVNIALFGIDARSTKSFEGLSDSIMILSLNTETKKVKIISVMRDSLVPIDYKGNVSYKKITTAYSTGGPELAIKTLNQNFGLDISEYATVNFYGMADIIDAVGGIDVTLTEREVTARGEVHGINDMINELCLYLGYDPDDYYVKKSGEQHLNGVQAVAYARIRYVPNIWGTNNDYGRTDRQRYVMEQLFNKATKLKKSQYTKMIKALIPCTQTSLSVSEIFSLAVDILLKNPTFEQTRIPQPEFVMTAPQGSFGSVVYYDLDYASKVIHGVIYEDVTLEKFVEENPIEKKDWYRKAVGSYTTSTSTPETSAPQNEETSTPDTTSSNETSSDNISSGDSDTSSGASSGSVSSGNSSTTSTDNTSSENTTSSTSSENTVSDGGESEDTAVSEVESENTSDNADSSDNSDTVSSSETMSGGELNE